MEAAAEGRDLEGGPFPVRDLTLDEALARLASAGAPAPAARTRAPRRASAHCARRDSRAPRGVTPYCGMRSTCPG